MLSQSTISNHTVPNGSIVVQDLLWRSFGIKRSFRLIPLCWRVSIIRMSVSPTYPGRCWSVRRLLGVPFGFSCNWSLGKHLRSMLWCFADTKTQHSRLIFQFFKQWSKSNCFQSPVPNHQFPKCVRTYVLRTVTYSTATWCVDTSDNCLASRPIT